MKHRFSSVSTFKQCPYKYKLQFIDKIEVIQDYEANNPLLVGTMLHRTLETGSRMAIDEYYNSFNIITNQHINEALKVILVTSKFKLPKGKHEIYMENEFYQGTIDFIDENNNLYDFKYSNNIDNYLDSAQLHVYKYFYEKINNVKINKLYYVFFEKTFIRQKNSETIEEFRNRLLNSDLKIQKIEIEYNQSKVDDFLKTIDEIGTDFTKVPNKFCDWCQYNKFCKEGEDWMILPKNERRNLSQETNKRLWIYGAPFSGKTTFANKFPEPLMLNTDGNIKFVDAPYIPIRDKVEVTGRLTKRTYAWQEFKNVIDELEKGSEFKTIIVDLLEDLYEHCRLFMYDQLGITHESDDSFRAWDKVRTEFLSNIKRLMNLDYENIILISHEDTSKDVTMRSGDKITAIKPNLQDKVANKVAGMVDVVARVYAEDNKRILSFKSDEVVFGGGRLNLRTKDIALDYEKFIEVYK